MTIIWCMVPEIWSTTDRIFCHSGPFFAILPSFALLPFFFLPFCPLTFFTFYLFCTFLPYVPRKSKFWKNEKNTWRCYHFTNVYHNVWFLRYGVQFCHFGQFFALLPQPNNPKNQNFEKMKKYLEISSFYTNAPKIMIKCCTVPEIRCVTDATLIFYFGLFFALLPPPTTQKIKIKKKKKMKKTPGYVIILHMCTKNNDHMMHGSWNIVHDG